MADDDDDEKMKMTVKFSGVDGASQEEAAKALTDVVKAVEPDAKVGMLVECDGCGTRYRHLASADLAMGEVRAAASRLGWAVNLENGEDFCPKCKEERKL